MCRVDPTQAALHATIANMGSKLGRMGDPASPSEAEAALGIPQLLQHLDAADPTLDTCCTLTLAVVNVVGMVPAPALVQALAGGDLVLGLARLHDRCVCVCCRGVLHACCMAVAPEGTLDTCVAHEPHQK